MKTFSEFNLPSALNQAIEALGYETPTPIQATALPPMLRGEDVIAQAQTGSGKTATFALAMLAGLQSDVIRLQGLVLCPTRELADQVTRELRAVARFIPNVKILSLCGGSPIRPQLASLSHEPHIVVGTPGRIEDLLSRQALDLSSVHSVVLDEADRMLDMGFVDAMRSILQHVPRDRRTWLFSATFPDEIEQISTEFQHQPQHVKVADQLDTGVIKQSFYRVAPEWKTSLLITLLHQHAPEACLVFCNTKVDTDAVANALSQKGVSARALHGGLDQRDREETLLQFANQSCQVLIATDVAARGLDIKKLPLVVSYELPNEAAVHVHRVGRTGRAGADGLALSLVSPREEVRVQRIEELQNAPVNWTTAPESQTGNPPMIPSMQTLIIDAGRQNKLRPGDILGALTGVGELAATDVGKIDIFPTRSYVAVRRSQYKATVQKLRDARIKGKKFRVRML